METKKQTKATPSRKPRAVLISDIHFNLQNLDLSSEALETAAATACAYNVPLIIAGDLTDGKAVIRGEVANRLCSIFALFPSALEIILLVGNHDLLNEKGQDHALHFLEPYCYIVASEEQLINGLYLIPYQSSTEVLQTILDRIPKGSTIIMHQGVQTAYMGHYVQDRTSLPKEAYADFRVISGHYHRAQDIKCGRPRKGAVGLFSYIGNPFTMSFGEANDGPKGYGVLWSDGILEQVVLPLRKHVVIEVTADERALVFSGGDSVNKGDLIWYKVRGPQSILSTLKKSQFELAIDGAKDFKLDLIPTVSEPRAEPKKDATGEETMDAIIDALPDNAKWKALLKATWRAIV